MNDIKTVRQLDRFQREELKNASRDASIRKRKIANRTKRELVVKKQIIGATVFALGIAATVGALGKTKYDDVVDTNNNKKIVSDELSDDKENLSEVVTSATHVTSDHLNTWVDYSEIGSYINDQEDVDRSVYALLTSFGQSDDPTYNGITDKSLSFVNDKDGNRYNGLNDYLSKKGMKNIDDYKKYMGDKILKEHQMEEIQSEVNNYSNNNVNNSIGGK